MAVSRDSKGKLASGHQRSCRLFLNFVILGKCVLSIADFDETRTSFHRTHAHSRAEQHHPRPLSVDNHAPMATDNLVPVVRPATISVAELVAFAKKELDADNEERQAKLQAASVGELPKESQTGATLDLSRKGISALPVEVIELIKDRVER